MVFSSNLFLFAFLPLCLLVYNLLPRSVRNLFLFVASTFFYMWGSGSVVVILLLSIVVNHFIARSMVWQDYRFAKPLLAAAVVFNLSFLLYYKYFNFFYGQSSRFLNLIGITPGEPTKILLPIGISFFTFQAIAYVVEVYRREQQPASRLIDFGMFLSFFPQLIAGPIVRYSDISRQIRKRYVSLDLFFQGVWRFTLGLGKKVVLANNLGLVADQIFKLGQGNLTPALAWLGIICYTFQIYYDFSGYSDMAIGMGRMFGFHFPENFDQPYRSQNITEFWRRWHMTLSSWFRDFLYIPLGGNRRGAFRTYANLSMVFLLCGLWHGAAWNFVIWGAFHGLLLTVERVMRNRSAFRIQGIHGIIWTNFFVLIGWVLFRAESLAQAWSYLKAMFGLHQATAFQPFGLRFYLHNDVILFLILAFFFALFPFEKVRVQAVPPALVAGFRGVAASVLMFYSASVLSTTGFNPFIYFRF